MEPAIIVHGGAWSIPASETDASIAGVESAASAGYDVLIAGGGGTTADTNQSHSRTSASSPTATGGQSTVGSPAALLAVETAVRVLECDPTFDAGYGSFLNYAGDIEMDAAIMLGSHHLPAGAVASLPAVTRNPVSVAKEVLLQTPHVLLGGRGAELFAREVGLAEVEDAGSLVAPLARAQWEERASQRYGDVVADIHNKGRCNSGHDTVGAVAIDAEGNIAAATSTGGITNKRVGRIGDSPIVGSGVYAENGVGGVSTTGHGESILKCVLAKEVVGLMEHKVCGSAEQAIERALHDMERKVGGRAGVICIDGSGDVAHGFSTERMAWASKKDATLRSGIDS